MYTIIRKAFAHKQDSTIFGNNKTNETDHEVFIDNGICVYFFKL